MSVLLCDYTYYSVNNAWLCVFMSPELKVIVISKSNDASRAAPNGTNGEIN